MEIPDKTRSILKICKNIILHFVQPMFRVELEGFQQDLPPDSRPRPAPFLSFQPRVWKMKKSSAYFLLLSYPAKSPIYIIFEKMFVMLVVFKRA